MLAGTPRSAGATPARWTALLLGTLTVGTLDALDAIIFFGLRGATPARIFQSIASGLLGSSAFAGGLATVALGLLLHYFIAFAIVSTYDLASRRLAILLRYPIRCGLLYGAMVYVFMNQVVVPLSAVVRGPQHWPVILNGLLIHLWGVGVPAALAARWGRAPSTRVGAEVPRQAGLGPARRSTPSGSAGSTCGAPGRAGVYAPSGRLSREAMS